MAQPGVDFGSPVPFTELKIDTSLTGSAFALVPAVANRQIFVFGLLLASAVPATTFKFQDASTDLTGFLSITSGFLLLSYQYKPWFETSVGNAFNILPSVATATQISGRIYYVVE